MAPRNTSGGSSRGGRGNSNRQGDRGKSNRGQGYSPVPSSLLRDRVKGNIALSNRAACVFALFAIIALIFFCRLVYLQVIASDQLSSEAEASRTIDIELSPKRGTIYDRNGNVLATDVEASTIYCDPTEIEDAEAVSAQLAAILGGGKSDYVTALTRADTSFSYIERKADLEKAEKVRALDIKGIYFLSDTKRKYPYGEVGGQIIGLVDIDGNGLTGLELYYNDILSGTAGHLLMEQGRTGITIAGTNVRTEAVDGQDIVISLDIETQKYVEKQMKDSAKRMGGESGQAILMDGATGEIIAACSTPFLDLNKTSDIKEGATELRCFTQAFEPGSIFKPVTMLAALEADVITPKTEIYCPEKLRADEYYVSDAHERDSKTFNVTEILEQSSNVGLSLIGKKLGFNNLYNKIDQYHLNMELTGVDYPGEATGYLTDPSTWSAITSYNVTFGQGVSETPLAMCRFYSALVNQGKICSPHFLISKPQDGGEVKYETTVITEDQDAINELNDMMIGVVKNGTGKSAAIDGFEVAGKTGTAEYADEATGGYVDNSYNLSFIGYLPNSDSDLVCFVGVTHVPTDSTTTAIFQDIMSYAIGRYNINQQ